MRDFAREQQGITDELGAARSRLEDLTERRARAQQRLTALQADREAAVATLDPDDKASGQRRRQLRDAEEVLADFAGAVRAAEARIGELTRVQERLVLKQRALVAQEAIAQHVKLAAAIDAKWRPFLTALHEFLESAADVAALARPLTGPGTSVEAPRGGQYAAVLLWRLSEVLSLDRELRGVLNRSARVSLHEHEASRCRPALETLGHILAE